MCKMCTYSTCTSVSKVLSARWQMFFTNSYARTRKKILCIILAWMNDVVFFFPKGPTGFYSTNMTKFIMTYFWLPKRPNGFSYTWMPFWVGLDFLSCFRLIQDCASSSRAIVLSCSSSSRARVALTSELSRLEDPYCMLFDALLSASNTVRMPSSWWRWHVPTLGGTLSLKLDSI